MLYEYALVPDIFDRTRYSSETASHFCLQQIKEVLLNEGLARNLRHGNWKEYIQSKVDGYDPKAKEFLKKLFIQNRISECPLLNDVRPDVDLGWAMEALASHDKKSLDGIIVSHQNAAGFDKYPIVASIENLYSTPWWNSRSPSRRMKRTIGDYISNLHLVLEHARSIMFIDPYLDPSQQNYGDFHQLIQHIAINKNKPKIEIHREVYTLIRGVRNRETNENWEGTFRNAFSAFCNQHGIQIDIFLWDHLHDRYLITDLFGMSLPHGFDTTADPNGITTWSRLGRVEKDDVQREHDPASGRHQLMYRLTIG